VVHDNLFQGSDAMAVLEEVIKTFSTEGDYIMDLTGKSGAATAKAAATIKRKCIVLCTEEERAAIRKEL
jgi:hypothetical protein